MRLGWWMSWKGEILPCFVTRQVEVLSLRMQSGTSCARHQLVNDLACQTSDKEFRKVLTLNFWRQQAIAERLEIFVKKSLHRFHRYHHHDLPYHQRYRHSLTWVAEKIVWTQMWLNLDSSTISVQRETRMWVVTNKLFYSTYQQAVQNTLTKSSSLVQAEDETQHVLTQLNSSYNTMKVRRKENVFANFKKIF